MNEQAWPYADTAELPLPPLDRATLALFAGASGDHNPVHIDSDFARRAGLPDVIGHGMLGMAWLGRLLNGWFPASALLSWQVRFHGVIRVGEQFTCRGRLLQRQPAGDGEAEGECVRVAIELVDGDGAVRTGGEALLRLPRQI